MTVSNPQPDDVALDAMAANERMGAALAYIYREAPEWKQRVADYLTDYPFEWQQHGHAFVPDDLPDQGHPSYTCAICGKRKAEHA